MSYTPSSVTTELVGREALRRVSWLPARHRVGSVGSWTALLAALVAFTCVAFPLFGPWDANVKPFDSDDAIIILMANQEQLTPFHLYYFGQDRFGAWPFLIGQAIHRLTGFWWTAEAAYAVQTVWRLLAIVPLMLLVRNAGVVLAAGYLAVTFLNAHAASVLLRVGQPYQWQIVTMIAAWLFIRLTIEAIQHERFLWRGLIYWSIAWYVAALATWISTLSFPMLLIAGIVEGMRAVLIGRHRSWHGLASLLVFGIVPSVIGLFVESVIRRWHADFTLATYGIDYRTPTSLDLASLDSNLAAFWSVYARSAWWPMAVIAPALIVAVLVWSIRTRRRGQAVDFERPGTLLIDLLAAATVFFGWAATNFIVSGSLTWVRLNQFDDRYVVISWVFWPLSAISALLALLVALNLGRSPLFGLAFRGVAIAVVLAALLVLPGSGGQNRYVGSLEAARAVAAAYPGTPVLGGHWGTYVFAALAPEAGLIPVVRRGDYDRMPWTTRELASAETVLVSHFLMPPLGNPAGVFLPPLLIEHGQVLAIGGPTAKIAGYPFTPYRNLSRLSHPIEIVPAADHLDLCDDGADVTVNVRPTPVITLVLLSDVPLFLRQPKLVVTVEDRWNVPVLLTETPGALVIEVDGSGGLVNAVRIFVQEGGRHTLPGRRDDVCPVARVLAVPEAVFSTGAAKDALPTLR